MKKRKKKIRRKRRDSRPALFFATNYLHIPFIPCRTFYTKKTEFKSHARLFLKLRYITGQLASGKQVRITVLNKQQNCKNPIF